MKLFLDNERFPPNNETGWLVARQFGDFCLHILANSHAIEVISFDHDLGNVVDHEDREMNGYYCTMWLIGAVMDGRISLPRLTEIRIHSMDPDGKGKIKDLLTSAIEHNILPKCRIR